MTEPIDIATTRGRPGTPARIAVVLPVAGTPGTGALVTGARARLRHAGRAGTVRLRRPGAPPAWPRPLAA